MPLREPTRLVRATPLRLIFPEPLNCECVVQPPTIQQATDCLMLDPLPGVEETPFQQVSRLLAQVTVLLGSEHRHLAGQMTMGQAVETLQALYAAAHGLDMLAMLQLQRGLAQQKRERDSLTLLREADEMTVELAALLKKLPAEVAQMPFCDAISVYERLTKNAKGELKFQAALHDKRLN